MKNLNLFRKSARGSEGSTLASAVVRPSFDRRSTVVKHLAFMLLFLLGSLNVWGTDVTYTFTSKSWADASSAWTGGSDGNGFTTGQGIQVTTGTTGANATSKSSFSNVSKVVVTYNTNKSKGAGSIVIKIGTNNEVSNSVAYSGSSDGTSANFTTQFDFSPVQTGAIKITTNTTTNSIWVKSITITYSDGGTPQPTVSVTPASWDFGTVHASAEASKVFSVSGSNLTAGNLTLTVPAGFSVSPSSISVDGTLAATNVTVSKNTSTEDDYAGNLEITGGGLESAKTVALTMTVDADPAPTGTFELFSGDIEEGDYVLVGYQTSSSKYYAMNSTVTSNQYLGITEVSIDANDQIVNPDASLVWTIEQSTNGYYIKQGSAYLDDNATSNKNYAQTVAEPTTTSEWTFAYDNTWTITNYGTETTKKTLSFNISASRVACYTAIQSGNTCFYLYKKVDGAVKPSAGLAFDAAQKLAKVAGTLTAPNLSTADGFDGTVTYASSDEAVVKVNASTGAITEIVAVGKAVITAHSDETENFREGSASYTIFVAEQAGTNEDPLTEASAKALIDNGCTLNVNVKGTVGVVGSLNTTYGSISLTLTDGFQFYGMLNTSGEQFTENPFVVGDVVTAVGNLKKHNTTYELDLNCQLVERIPFAGSKTSIANTKETAYTIAQALAYAADPTTYDLTDHVYIAGVVYQVNSFNSTNGTYNIYIKDAGTSEDDGKFEFYKCSGLYEVGGTPAQFAEGDVQIGDEVIGYGVMTYFSGGSIWEFGQPNQLVALNRPTVPVTSINLTESTATVEEGKTVTLHASVLPNNATDQDIVWTVVSGDTYASVDNGVVTGIAAGEAVIRAASHEDASIHAECTVTVTEPAPLSPWATTYTSNVTMAHTGSGVDNGTITIGTDDPYLLVKAGASSSTGTIVVTVPKGTTDLHFHAFAWGGKTAKIELAGVENASVSEFDLAGEAGASGSGNDFTLQSDPVDQYFHVSFDAVAAVTEITFSKAAGSADNRFFFYGVNQEGGVIPVLKSIEISGDLTNKSGYKVGDDLDLDGLTVEATYSLGGVAQSPVDITSDPELELTYDPLVEDQTEVTITASYKGQTDDITITGLDPVASADPKIYVSTLNVNFASVEVGESVPAAETVTVTLTNVASVTATLGGTNADAFSVSPASLTESGDITISILANTDAAASYAATLTISDGEGGADDKTVNLSFAVTEPVVEDDVTGTWTLVTNATTLAAGKKVIIAQYVEADGAINTMAGQASNNRSVIASTVAGATLTPAVGTKVMTLADAGEGNFYLKTSDGEYLYNASTSSKSYLRTKAEEENVSWTIAVDAEGVATITSVENTNRTKMRYNPNTSGSPLFNCYASGQEDIALYMLEEDTPEPPVVDYTEVRNGLTEGWYYTMCLDKAVTAVKAGSIWRVLSKAANGNDVILEEVIGTLDAGRPYIFRAAASTLEVAYTGDAVGAPVNDEDNNGLVGSFSQVKIANVNTNYIIYNNALYFVNTDNVYVGENRAYLDMTGVPAYSNEPQQGAPRRRVTMAVHGEQVATGMESIQPSEISNQKVLINGQLFILRGEKMYDATGMLVK